MLEQFTRYPLTFGPTPIEKLPRLSEHLGGQVEVCAKREDCNSGLAFGGNKLRKLEYIVPDALAWNADKRLRARVAVMRWILCACILAQAGAAQADEQKGIVLKGIHWGMSYSEMVTTLENRGYDCEKNERYSSYYCKKGNGDIRILDTLVRFNCDTLGTCEYESEEVAQMIINKGLVKDMDYEYESGYCGRSDVGDKICAKGGAVYLHKDASGRPDPSFN